MNIVEIVKLTVLYYFFIFLMFQLVLYYKHTFNLQVNIINQNFIQFRYILSNQT